MVLALMIALAVALVALAVVSVRRGRAQPTRAPAPSTHRILFPFIAQDLSPRALDAALRLARAEDATLVPVFLARVSLDLPLDSPLPRQARTCIPLQEAIEHRAAQFGVPVDARIERGRTFRHALRQAISAERFDRLVIAAATESSPGFHAEDVAWLLGNAAGEIVVLRPDPHQLVQPLPPRRKRGRRSRPARERDRRVAAHR